MSHPISPINFELFSEIDSIGQQNGFILVIKVFCANYCRGMILIKLITEVKIVGLFRLEQP